MTDLHFPLLGALAGKVGPQPEDHLATHIRSAYRHFDLRRIFHERARRSRLVVDLVHTAFEIRRHLIQLICDRSYPILDHPPQTVMVGTCFIEVILTDMH
ncbi:hypothetical protein D9M68_825730 [compost metagenome]